MLFSLKIPPLNDEEFSKSVAEIANSRRSALASMKLSKEQQLTGYYYYFNFFCKINVEKKLFLQKMMKKMLKKLV